MLRGSRSLGGRGVGGAAEQAVVDFEANSLRLLLGALDVCQVFVDRREALKAGVLIFLARGFGRLQLHRV